MMGVLRLVFIVAGFLAGSAIALAQDSDRRHPTLDLWYPALEQADREGLSALISNEAEPPFQYVIKDLGITQNAEEFIASMDEWETAIKDGSIRYQFIDDGIDAYLVRVCYKFANSELLAQEQINFDSEKIAKIIQSSVGDKCEGF